MLDKQLAAEINNATAYGKSSTEFMQEQQLNRIAQSYDQQKTNFESDYNIQKAYSDAEFTEAVRQDESHWKFSS